MILRNFFSMYVEGFRNMTWGRKLWLIVLLKLFFMFFVLKMFFFPNYLKTNFKTDEERSEHVIENITTLNTNK